MESGNHEITQQSTLLSSRQLLDELHAQIRAEKLSSDAKLHQIVEAARILSRAHGAAIAVRQDDSVLCMATAGSMAPALGSELQVDSGISGQCLRTGAPLYCEDTSTDPRVDGEVCDRLGLRSIAVAPLGKWPAVAGVLEVFSATPHAFQEAELQLLAELADLVELPPSTLAQPTGLGAPEKSVTQQDRTTSSVLSASLKLARSTWKLSNGRLIVAAVIMFIVVIWLGIRLKAVRPNASAAAPQPRSTLGAPPAPTSADMAKEPSTPPANAASPPPVAAQNPTSAPGGALMASATGKTSPSEPIPHEPKAAVVVNTPAPAATLTSPPPPTTVDVASAPPLDIVSANGNAALKGVLSSATPSPVLPEPESSTGVSGGTIEQLVRPIYPAEAVRLKRSGRVVLQAVITKEGTVGDLKVIEGDSLLARAAMDAVAEWRYKPYVLNGEPIQRTTEITINFKLP